MLSEVKEEDNKNNIKGSLKSKFDEVEDNETSSLEKAQREESEKWAEEINLLGDLESAKKQPKKEFNSEIKHLDAIQS